MSSPNVDIGRLVTGKARRFLRTAITLVLLALIGAGSYLVMLERQRVQNRRDFSANPAVHLIRVQPPDERGASDGLKFADIGTISTAAAQAGAKSPVRTAVVYKLSFGIQDANNHSWFIYGVGGAASELLGVPTLKRATGYSTAKLPAGEIKLLVPVIEAEAGGWSSSRREAVRLHTAPPLPQRAPITLVDHVDDDTMFVSGRTFAKLASHAFDERWSTIRQRSDESNPYGSGLVGNVYLYVQDLSDVKRVAAKLEAAGYPTDYTLRAFDDLAGSLNSSARLGLFVVCAALLAGLLYVVLSFASFMRVSHKDLAILKHSGFDDREINQMYRRRAASVLLTVGGVLAIVLGMLGSLLLGAQALRLTLLNVAIFGGLLAFTYAVVAAWVIPRQVRQGVLTLLKVDREFG
ncbi:MAG: hypothetical protein QM679_03440 [Patulibacter sp.]